MSRFRHPPPARFLLAAAYGAHSCRRWCAGAHLARGRHRWELPYFAVVTHVVFQSLLDPPREWGVSDSLSRDALSARGSSWNHTFDLRGNF